MKRMLIPIMVMTIMLSAYVVHADDYNSKEMVQKVQTALNDSGYNCGEPDGVTGNATKSAIASYRADHGLTEGDSIDEELCTALQLTGDSEAAATSETTETNIDFVDKSDGSLLKGLNITAEEIKQIYDEFQSAWETYPEDPAEASEYEAQVTKEIAEKHGLTEQQTDNVYFYVVTYGPPAASDTFTLKNGELLDTTISGSRLVIKSKIGTSKMDTETINKNYSDICDIIKNQGGNAYDEIQLWTVADVDGSEKKVMSFTVPKSVIDLIYESGDHFEDDTLGDLVDDLYIYKSQDSIVEKYKTEIVVGADMSLGNFIANYKISLAPQLWTIAMFDDKGAVIASTSVTYQDVVYTYYYVGTPNFEGDEIVSFTPHYLALDSSITGTYVLGDDHYCDEVFASLPK